MNTKKTFIMSEKPCPKYVPGLTNMPKKKQKCKPTSNSCVSSAWDWSDTISNIKSKWSIGFECPHSGTFSLFRVLTICLISKCYGNIS